MHVYIYHMVDFCFIFFSTTGTLQNNFESEEFASKTGSSQRLSMRSCLRRSPALSFELSDRKAPLASQKVCPTAIGQPICNLL